MIAGLIDLLAIPRSNKQAMALALYHSFLNGLIILIFAVIAYKSWQMFPSTTFDGVTGLVVKGILVFALFIGNYMGGRLIYTYYIGINFKQTIKWKPYNIR